MPEAHLTHRSSRPVVGVLQLLRVGLIFTAIADSLAGALLAGEPISADLLLPLAGTSALLFCFGMGLNDWLDRARDRHAGRPRPIVTGAISANTAALVMTLAAVGAVALGAALSQPRRECVLAAAVAILLYHLNKSLLPSLAILWLGLIRGVNTYLGAAAPEHLLLPMWNFAHVIAISAAGYVWEYKRPLLSANGWRLLVLGTVVILALAGHQLSEPDYTLLIGPAILALVFWITIWTPRWRRFVVRDGLLLLIAMDAAAVWAGRGLGAALLVLALLGCAILTMRLMRQAA